MSSCGGGKADTTLDSEGATTRRGNATLQRPFFWSCGSHFFFLGGDHFHSQRRLIRTYRLNVTSFIRVFPYLLIPDHRNPFFSSQLLHFNRRYSKSMGIQLVLKFSQLQFDFQQFHPCLEKRLSLRHIWKDLGH